MLILYKFSTATTYTVYCVSRREQWNRAKSKHTNKDEETPRSHNSLISVYLCLYLFWIDFQWFVHLYAWVDLNIKDYDIHRINNIISHCKGSFTQNTVSMYGAYCWDSYFWLFFSGLTSVVVPSIGQLVSNLFHVATPPGPICPILFRDYCITYEKQPNLCHCTGTGNII